MKNLARALLAVLLLLGVYLLAGGLLAATGWTLWWAFTHDLGTGPRINLVLFALVVCGPILVALGQAARHRASEPEGLSLPVEEQPALWEEVRALADVVGTRPPDVIRLVPEVNAAVWEGSRLLGLVAGRRVMLLGSPLLQGLTRQQLRAVLAHELGHYSHRHTALSPVVYRGHVTLGHLVDQLGEDTRIGRLFAAYGRLYLRLTSSVTRRQEVEADAWAHRTAGRDAAAQAMREVAAVAGLWDHFLQDYAFAVDGARPDALHEGFGRLLASPRRQEQMEEFRRELPEPPATPYDTHPPTRARVDLFESLPDDGVRDDRTPALATLADPDATLLRLEAMAFADSALDPQPWEVLAHTAGAQRSRANAAMLVRATREHGSGAATLRDAVAALSHGRARNLVRPYLDIDTPPDAVDHAARRLVKDMVAMALVEHCEARFTPEWDGEPALADSAGRPIDVPGLLEATIDEGSAGWLVRALEEEGVPASYSIDVTALEEQDALEQEPAAVAVCVQMRRVRIVVVTDSGLLVKRIGFAESLRRIKRVTHDPYRNMLHYVASLSVGQLLADPRVEAFPWERVQEARLRRRRLRLVLDGHRRDLRIRRGCVAGDLAASMRHHLDARFAVS